ncbi:MAG: V-type ATP synthase subunit E family protein [Candidatus Cloacimonadaceae bacterium]|nr:V-type ATP synthase subunit E family protein [Candidatus Cloacimonadaceae bacterium]MDP3113161.1 V-type ATP synthase subunit E family protein [Candidatus Cloacimonadaceae bacterium]
MNDQLQDLLQRVYDEGVAKAKAEAEKIIDEAKNTAENTLKKAQTDAETILADAKKQADELKKNTDSDLKMAAGHTLSSVKQKITDLILALTFEDQLRSDFSDPEFLKKLIMEAMTAWKQDSASIIISASMRDKLDSYYIETLKKMFTGGLKVDFSPVMKSGFSISPKDGGYKLSFTDEDFANLFKTYLRPRTGKILFES